MPLETLRTWVAESKSLLLEYVVTTEGTFVLVVPGDGGKPRIEAIVVPKELERSLTAPVGPLTRNLAYDECASTLDLLSRPGQTAPVRRRAWRLYGNSWSPRKNASFCSKERSIICS